MELGVEKIQVIILLCAGLVVFSLADYGFLDHHTVFSRVIPSAAETFSPFLNVEY